MKYFENKVALVTGSGQGIGKAIALAFAKEGALIVLNGRNAQPLKKVEEELKAMDAIVFTVVGDVSDEIQAKNIVDKTIERFGRLDFLINNAGISMRGDFSELKPTVFKSVFATNVFGITNLSIPALPYLKRTKGSLIFISSLAGINGLPGLSAYCSSKMALRAIAESIRIEEFASGIHVGLIQVGFTEIEPAKQTMGPDGELILIKDRANFKVQTKEFVAKTVLKNIRSRKFITTLSGIGRLQALLHSYTPMLLEKILIRSSEKIKARS